ncbi:MAG: hypothetical protein ACK443_06830 [Methylococcaceae bacterium]|jgi:hypothetical protein
MTYLTGNASRALSIGLLAAAMLAGCTITPKPLTPITANDPEMKALDADRAKYREKKVALIEKALNLSPAEHDAFWREYYPYEAELKKIYDERYSIIRDYATHYDNMNNDIADNLALRSLKVRDDRNDLFRKYYNRIKKSTSALVAGQFLQIENELNLLSDLKISTETPILPRDVNPASAEKK